MNKIGITIGSVKLWLWSGEWTLLSRNGLSSDLIDLHQCECHRFALFAGPLGIEVR